MDNPLHPLLCRAPLLPDESLPSYLVRLTAFNCYEQTSVITKLCEKRLAAMGLRDNLERPKHPETLDLLAALTGLPPCELANASVHHFTQAPVLTRGKYSPICLSDGCLVQLLDTTTRLRHFLRPELAKFCPDCLQEAAYHRLTWMLQDATVCLKHQRLLVDRCQRCNSLVHIQDITRCRCGACGDSLARMTAEPTQMEPFGLFAQRTIQMWWGVDGPPIDEMPWTLPEQPVPILHQLFGYLANSIQTRRSSNNAPSASTPSGWYTIQTLAFKALTNWPLGFCAFLRECLEYEVLVHSYYHGDDFSEPTWLRNKSSLNFWLCNFQDWTGFSFVQEAVDRFLAENNIRVYPDRWGSCICVHANEDLQKIAQPIAQKMWERAAKAIERAFGEEQP